MNSNDPDLEYSADSSRKQKLKKQNPINIINEQCFDKKKLEEQKIFFTNNTESSYFSSKP